MFRFLYVLKIMNQDNSYLRLKVPFFFILKTCIFLFKLLSQLIYKDVKMPLQGIIQLGEKGLAMGVFRRSTSAEFPFDLT